MSPSDSAHDAIQTPFRCRDAVVKPEWIDYNGHMNVGYYHVAFDLAVDDLFEHLGLTPELRQRHDSSTFGLESHLHYLRELKEGAPLRFEARLLDFDYKRIHFYVEMFHATEGYLAASYESLSAHVNIRERRTAPMPEALTRRLTAVKAAHDALPRPWMIGHVISAHPPRATGAG